jgi:hypothetical protein
MKEICLLLLLISGFFFAPLCAQQTDSLAVLAPDSLGTTEKIARKNLWDKTLGRRYPNPRAAALLSLALPGAGQAYNKKWWKVPVVWGVIGGVAYATFDTRSNYIELRDNYKLLVDGNPETAPVAPYDNLDAQTLKRYRDQFRGYTEKWFIALGIVYLLNVTDAFVDAHLTTFDVSDNLSLRLKPSFEGTYGGYSIGVGIAMNLSGPPNQPLPVFPPFFSP